MNSKSRVKFYWFLWKKNLITSLYPEVKYPIPFEEVYLLPKVDFSSFFVTGNIEIFKLAIFLTLRNSKLLAIFPTLKLTLLVHFNDFGRDVSEEQSKTSPFDNKFKNQA